jgi:hypothetical protein
VDETSLLCVQCIGVVLAVLSLWVLLLKCQCVQCSHSGSACALCYRYPAKRRTLPYKGGTEEEIPSKARRILLK